MKLTPLDIRHKEFKRGMRGYVDGEVDEFLDEVADEFERLFKENIELSERGEALQEKLDQYRNLEETLQNTLVAAQRSAEELKANAQKEAQLMLSEAELKARQMVNQSYGDKQAVEKQIVVLKSSEEDFRFKFRSLLEGYQSSWPRPTTTRRRPPSSPARPSRSKTPWRATRPVAPGARRCGARPGEAPRAAASRHRPRRPPCRRAAAPGRATGRGARARRRRPAAQRPAEALRRDREATTRDPRRPDAGTRPGAGAATRGRRSWATPTTPPRRRRHGARLRRQRLQVVSRGRCTPEATDGTCASPSGCRTAPAKPRRSPAWPAASCACA